jgi:hypothetical protein
MLELLPEDMRPKIPALYSQEKVKLEEKQVCLKFFFPAGNWTWFVTEGEAEGDDFVFFGFVVGDFDEWGYFTLNELESINFSGLTVERDLHFKPGKFSDVLAQFRRACGQ